MALISSHIQTLIFDLDGTLYDKKGLAFRMVCRLWWCLPLLAAERRARTRMKNCHFDSREQFYEAFFATMSKGHLWGTQTAHTWYDKVYMPTMIKIIGEYHKPSAKVLKIIDDGQQKGLTMAVFSDYGCVEEKLRAIDIDSKCFALCVDAPSLGALKPEKTIVLDLLKQLNADPRTTLFIGDRDDKDGEAARVVGAHFMHILNL